MSKEKARATLINMIDEAIQSDGSIVLLTTVPGEGTKTQLVHCNLIALLLVQHSLGAAINKWTSEQINISGTRQ